MPRTLAAAVATAFAAIALQPGLSLAQDKPVALKISHWVPASHPMHKPTEEWAASMTKASGGTLTFSIFPAQQLGKAFDHYDMARDGIADFTMINPGYQPGRFPIAGAMELPFITTNAKGGSKAIDEWYRRYAGKEMGDVKFCLMTVHEPGTFHSRTKKIVMPEDVKGLKVRKTWAGNVRKSGNDPDAILKDLSSTIEKAGAAPK